jgi:hypothetical protein
MLSPDDQRLVALDQSLPGLCSLLDDDAMTGILQNAWPALRITRAHANYVRYKLVTSCIVGYSIDTEHSGLSFGYARVHRPETDRVDDRLPPRFRRRAPGIAPIGSAGR